MLIGRVVEDELGDDPQAAPMSGVQELAEVVERAVARMDAVVIRDVVPIVAERRPTPSPLLSQKVLT
jgi:hypothetical protein